MKGGLAPLKGAGPGDENNSPPRGTLAPLILPGNGKVLKPLPTLSTPREMHSKGAVPAAWDAPPIPAADHPGEGDGAKANPAAELPPAEMGETVGGAGEGADDERAKLLDGPTAANAPNKPKSRACTLL
jgi:hypothetical protein